MFKSGIGGVIGQSLLEGEESSVFKEEEIVIEKVVVKNGEPSKLPMPKLSRRRVSSPIAMLFYGVVFLTATISLGLNFFAVDLVGTASSLVILIASIYGYLFTEPSRWKGDYAELSFWNASVTISVLAKSLHPKIYAWKSILLISVSVIFFIGLFWNGVLSGVLLAMYLGLGLLFFAERELEMYSQIAFVLSWASVLSLIFSLVVSQGLSLGVALIGLILHQVHERTSELEIEVPEEE